MSRFQKLLSLAIICLTITFVLTSCNNTTVSSDNGKYSENNYADENNTNVDNHAVSLTEISQSGVISYDNFCLTRFGPYYTNTSGNLCIPFEYNSRYGYADQNGNPVIENLSGSNILPHTLSEGLAFYQADGNYYVIDAAGEKLFTLPDDVSPESFKNGTCVMLKKEHVPDSLFTYDYNVYVCLLDTNMNYMENKILLPDGMSIGQDNWYAINESGFQGALGTYGSKTTDAQIAIVNSSGKIVTSFDANSAYQAAKSAFSFVNISASITHAAAVGLSDADLTKMIFFKNGYVNVMGENGKWGLINLQTEELAIDYSYDYVGACSDGLIPVCQYGIWGVIDIDGNMVIPCQSFKYIGAFTNGRALAISEDENICIIDKEGNIVSNVDVSVGASTLGGNTKSFFYTDFTEATHIACIYLYEKAYLISDSGEILLSGKTDSYASINTWLYMNNDYLVFCGGESTSVYKINT